MAERVARLEPNLYGGQSFFYAEPNPALTEALVGGRLAGIVADYTYKTGQTFLMLIADRPRIGDKHPGAMAEATEIRPPAIGGYKSDRWVGEIVVNIDYASADEFGRDAYNPYPGHHDLATALYMNLPRI